MQYDHLKKRLLSGGLWVFSGKIVSSMSGLVIGAMLARMLSTEEMAAYFLIVSVVPVVALVGQGGQTNYAASKAGILGFSRSLAREVGSRQITVNVVTPGYFATALTEVLSEEIVESSKELIPLGRWGELPEVAHLVAFLASEKAAYITGQTISVDGGISM